MIIVAFAKAEDLACNIKLLTHYAKGTILPLKALSAYKTASSGSISPVIDLLFMLSLTVLFTIAKHIILSLGGWHPPIQTDFIPSYSLACSVLYSKPRK